MKSKVGFHIFLFLVTFLTLTYKEAIFAILLMGRFDLVLPILQEEYPYSLTLILILLAHEMGHYLPARFYGLKATLPYFIPLPVSPVGTMGAVIKIQEAIPDKKQLFDIGVGGPLASLILSSICWVIGLFLSSRVDIQSLPDTGNILFFGDSIFTYYTGMLIQGPYDSAVQDIAIHPLARAGWVGLLITAINLLPFGQLDGGHVIYSVFGEKYRNWIYYLFLCFLLMGFINFSWVIWGFLIFFLIKVEHPYVPDPSGGLDSNRKLLGYFMLFSLILIFVPTPLVVGKGDTTLLHDIIESIKGIF